MTQPRRLLPNMTHSITRRVARRCLALKPNPQINQIFLYAMGRAQQRRRVQVHATVTNCSHHHTVATDRREGAPEPLGLSPEQRETSDLDLFLGHFHGLTARAFNTHYGRGENFWRSGSYDNCELWNAAAQLKQCLYAWTNPVKDGLIDHPDEWEGVMTLPEDFGTRIPISKPKGAFFGGRRPASHRVPRDLDALARMEREFAAAEAEALVRSKARDETKQRKRSKRKSKTPRSKKRQRGVDRDRRRRVGKLIGPQPFHPPEESKSSLPDLVYLEITPPPAWQHLPIEEVRAFFRAELEREVAEIHAEREREGKRTMSSQALQDQHPFEASGPTRPTFQRNPRVCCPGDWELRFEVLRGLKAFRSSYRESWRRRHKGGTVFPAGTTLMRRLHKARVAPGTGPPLRAA